MSRLRSVRYKGFSGNLTFRAPRYTSILALSMSAADDLYASDGFLPNADDELSDGWDKPQNRVVAASCEAAAGNFIDDL